MPDVAHLEPILVAGGQAIRPTISLAEAAARTWDVAIVGAGPAGSFAALQIARGGAAVILIDKAQFPRSKVCGCCLNGRALEFLATAGLTRLEETLGAQPLDRLHVAAGLFHADLPLPGGMALSRTVLDAELAARAIDAGACFLPGAQAQLLPTQSELRTLSLKHDDQEATISARVVLAADGLAGQLLHSEPGMVSQVQSDSRMGAGALVATRSADHPAGAVFMAYGKHGYVGLVRLADNQLDVAGAFDLAFVKNCGGPGAAALHVLSEAGLPPVEGLAAENWRATPALSRQRASVAGDRVFAIGDATGYVEPFTGEGISWALAGAEAVAPLALEAAQQWRPSLARRWQRTHREMFRGRQRACRILSQILRRPWLARPAVRLLHRTPVIAAPIVAAIHGGRRR